MRRALAVAALAVAMVACVQPPEEAQRPPDTIDAAPLPTPSGPHRVGEVDAPSSDPAAASTLEEREARAASLRLRVTGGQLSGVSVGSGFAIDDHTVITNAHVVGDGDHVEMASWDGYDVEASVEQVAVRHDLAVLTTARPVPSDPLEPADGDPADGDVVTVVGFPDGGRVMVDDGARVIDTFDADVRGVETGEFPSRGVAAEIAVPERIVRIDTDSVRRGSSGGPVLDGSGDLVGVVFALDAETGDALAVPVSVLRGWLEQV